MSTISQDAHAEYDRPKRMAWEVDLGVSWVRFDPQTEKLLNEARLIGDTSTHLNARGWDYILDFTAMKQINVSTQASRTVRCTEVDEQLEESEESEESGPLGTIPETEIPPRLERWESLVSQLASPKVQLPLPAEQTEEEARLTPEQMQKVCKDHVPGVEKLLYRGFCGLYSLEFMKSAYQNGIRAFQGSPIFNHLLWLMRLIVHHGFDGKPNAKEYLTRVAHAFEDCQAVQAREIEQAGLEIKGVGGSLHALVVGLVGDYKGLALKMLALERVQRRLVVVDGNPTHYENRLTADLGDNLRLSADDVRRAKLDEHARNRFPVLDPTESERAAPDTDGEVCVYDKDGMAWHVNVGSGVETWRASYMERLSAKSTSSSSSEEEEQEEAAPPDDGAPVTGAEQSGGANATVLRSPEILRQELVALPSPMRDVQTEARKRLELERRVEALEQELRKEKENSHALERRHEQDVQELQRVNDEASQQRRDYEAQSQRLVRIIEKLEERIRHPPRMASEDRCESSGTLDQSMQRWLEVSEAASSAGEEVRELPRLASGTAEQYFIGDQDGSDEDSKTIESGEGILLNAPLLPNAHVFTCIACAADLSEEMLFPLMQCSDSDHKCCRECMRGHVTAKISEKYIHAITCPHPECKGSVMDEEIKIVTDEATYNAYVGLMKEQDEAIKAHKARGNNGPPVEVEGMEIHPCPHCGTPTTLSDGCRTINCRTCHRTWSWPTLSHRQKKGNKM